MSVENTGYQSKRKNSSQSVEELISVIHMRDRLIEELRESVKHKVYMSMCDQLMNTKHALEISESIVMKYQQHFNSLEQSPSYTQSPFTFL